jgi:HSF-type DNA-binding
METSQDINQQQSFFGSDLQSYYKTNQHQQRMSAFLTNLDLSKIKARPARNAESRFPCKLYRLLLDVDEKGLSHIISWHPNGTCFRVHDPDTFSRDIMPVYFKPGKYRSFQRQLNLYGFQRFTALKPFWESCYRHPAFTLSQRLGCTKIDRPIRQKKSSSDNNSVDQQQQQEQQPEEAPPSPTPLPPSLPNDTLSASTFLPSSNATNGTSRRKWSHDDEEWLKNQSVSNREQWLTDASAARWRMLGEALQAPMNDVGHGAAAADDIMDNSNRWDPSLIVEPLPFGTEDEGIRAPEIRVGEQQQYQQQIQQLQQNSLISSSSPMLPTQQHQQLQNNTIATATAPIMQNENVNVVDESALNEPVWLANDVNLCHEIMGQDCDLCMDGNKLVDDFFRQRAGQQSL